MKLVFICLVGVNRMAFHYQVGIWVKSTGNTVWKIGIRRSDMQQAPATGSCLKSIIAFAETIALDYPGRVSTEKAWEFLQAFIHSSIQQSYGLTVIVFVTEVPVRPSPV